MKHYLKLMSIAAISVCSFACRSKAEPSKLAVDDKKVLVCYFSATGATKADAEKIARILDAAELFEIEPQTMYTSDDLDWTNDKSRSSVEMKDSTSRPPVKGIPENIDSYDYIFLGFPNWWNLPPTIVNTFIEQASLDGKKVVPFMTSGSSSIDNSESSLRTKYPAIEWVKGLRTTGASEKILSEWARGIVYD